MVKIFLKGIFYQRFGSVFILYGSDSCITGSENRSRGRNQSSATASIYLLRLRFLEKQNRVPVEEEAERGR